MITIDWLAFLVVLGVSLLASLVIVSFFAVGLRLLSVGSPVGPGEDEAPPIVAGARPPFVTLAAGLCFAVCVAAVLFGVWVIVPQFH